MKMIASEYRDHNLYYTVADQSRHALHTISPARMLQDLCLFSLFAEHVVLAASHLFEAALPRRIVRSNPELLSSQAVVVDLRDDCRDFRDFIEHKRSLRNAEPHWHRSDREEFARFLDAHCPVVMSWPAQSEPALLKDLLLGCLQSEGSEIRDSIAGVSRNELLSLVSVVSEMVHVRRELLFEAAEKNLGPWAQSFKWQVNAAYYLSGALHKNLRPALAPAYFLSLSHSTHVLQNRSHGAIERAVAIESLREIGVDSTRLRHDPCWLLDFRSRNISLVHRFREKWWELLESTTATGREPLDVVAELREELVREQSPMRSLRRVGRIGTSLSIATLAVGGLNLLLDLGLGWYSWGVSAAARASGFAASTAGKRLPLTALATAIRAELEEQLN